MNIYPLSGRIDSSNASSFEEDINRFVNDNKLDELVLDCNDLLYISSAGLRVILHLRKKINNIALINVSPVVYEVLSITGFSEMLVVEKALNSSPPLKLLVPLLMKISSSCPINFFNQGCSNICLIFILLVSKLKI